MPKNCSNCNLKYEHEPGFFFGAMFVSYAFSIIIAGITWFALALFDLEFYKIIWAVAAVLLLSIPATFKVSRAIWLNFFFHYKQEKPNS